MCSPQSPLDAPFADMFPPPVRAPSRGKAAASGDPKARLELHPAVRAAREEHEKTSLLVGDVAKNASLAQHFQQYTLRDYFDHRGQRVYQNLSMSLAAKNYPDIGSSFGSVAVADDGAGSGKGKHLSARAYRLATEMVQKDRDAIKQKNNAHFQNLDEGEKVQLQDVQKRQQEMIFIEVPSDRVCMPPGCELKDVLPFISTRLQEREERRRFEKLNKELLEGGYQSMHTIQLQQWVFGYEGVQQVIRSAAAWTTASGLSTTLGVDRATFCQFILDLDLIDQETVPYVWAVSVFDDKARLVKTCAGDPEGCDPHHEGRIPVMPLVCKWDFIVVLDTILRRRLEHVSAELFLSRLAAITSKLQAEWQRQEQEEQGPDAGQSGNSPNSRKPGEQSPSKVKVRKIKTWQNDKSTLFEAQGIQSSIGNAWSQQPKGGSGIEVAAWKRNRRMAGMLVEPEVLQLVEQYRGLFQQFFNHYLDEGQLQRQETPGNDSRPGSRAGGGGPLMEFGSLLQFCHDFRVVPRLASRHEVLRAFLASESHQSAPVSKEASCRGSGAASADISASDAPAANQQAASPPPARGSQSQAPPRGNITATVAAKRFSAAVAGGFKRRSSQAVSPTVSNGSATSPSPTGSLSARRASTGASPQPGSAALNISLPISARKTPVPGHGNADKEEERHTSEQRRPQTKAFGLAVFVETLCRIAFGYFIANGNSVQLATSSRTKVVWLVAYLHGVFLNLQRSHGRRQGSSANTFRPVSSATPDSPGFGNLLGPDATEAGMPTPPSTAGSSLSRRLALVLEQVTPSMFTDPAQPTLQLPPRPASQVQPLPFCNLGSLSRRHGSHLLDSVLSAAEEAEAAAEEGEAKIEQEPLRTVAEPPSPSSASSKSYRTTYEASQAGDSHRRTSRNRRLPRDARKEQERAAAEEEKRRLEEPKEQPIPRDAFTFQSLLFYRLLQSTTRSLELPEGHDDRVAHAAAAKRVPAGAPNNCSRRILATPCDATHGTGRRLVCCIQSEREALHKRLHEAVPRLERCCLTPPPSNAFAVQLSDRVERMMAATR